VRRREKRGRLSTAWGSGPGAASAPPLGTKRDAVATKTPGETSTQSRLAAARRATTQTRYARLANRRDTPGQTTYTKRVSARAFNRSPADQYSVNARRLSSPLWPQPPTRGAKAANYPRQQVRIVNSHRAFVGEPFGRRERDRTPRRYRMTKSKGMEPSRACSSAHVLQAMRAQRCLFVTSRSRRVSSSRANDCSPLRAIVPDSQDVGRNRE